MILSVLLPMWGPWLDPSFAGRMPQHDHLRFGNYDPNHHHGHEGHEETSQETPLERYADLLSSIVSIPDLDVSLQGLLLLIVTGHVPALHQPDTRYILAGNGVLITHGITIKPPVMPPRF